MDSMQQQQQQQQNLNYNGMQQQQQQQQPSNANKNMRKKPYVKITEQPAGKALRFRYECEGRSAGSIPGVNSTPENKTYPTIEIVGYKGRAVVVVSCVTKDQPYRPHPHNLVGKEGCKKGVCTLEINSETMRAVFSNLGIQCVKKKDIEAALKAREEIRVDPFKTGFTHRYQPSSIDLNSVRLCFQVFMESDQKGRFTQPLPPVVSEPIYDKKAMSDLVICRLCSCSATVLGNTQIILLCEKVAKEDIAVRFFEEKNGQLVWEAYGEFQHTDVHKQTAIAFKTPRYHTIDITEPAKVFIQLKRPSDGVTSEPLPFEYVPLDSGRKRFLDLRRNLKRKPDFDIFHEILAVDSGSDKQEIPVPAMEVIDLNTPTKEQPQSVAQTIVSDTTSTTLTNDPNNDHLEHDGIDDEEAKRRSQQEIDTIIDEKMRELEQQQQLGSLQQVVEILKPAEETQTPAPTQSEQTAPPVETMQQQDANEKIAEWIQSNELQQGSGGEANAPAPVSNECEDKSLSDLLDQVAELDEIYSKHVVRRDTYNNILLNELNGIDACVPEQNTNIVDGGQTAMEVDDSFDDAATYSSLQIAFKNPITIPMEDIMPPTPPASVQTDIVDSGNYDPVQVTSGQTTHVTPDIVRQAQTQTPPFKTSSPHMHVTAVEEEKLPPLPPKRLRKQDSNAENRSIEANIGDQNRKSRQQAPILITKPNDQLPPTKRLPQKPGSSNTLPRPKKPGFFSKLFSRKSKSDLSQAGDLETTASKATSKAASPVASREPSITYFDLKDSHRASLRSAKSLQPPSLPSSPSKTQKVGKPVARSVSSVSGKRRQLYYQNADVIHIPLKGELYPNEEYSQASTITLANTLDQNTVSVLEQAQIPISDGNMELVAIADREGLRNLTEGQFNVELDPSMDLTEAEHYALYTTVPPKATASEFDEASAYYAPVDAGEILTPEEVAQRLVAANHPAHLRRKRQKTNGDPVHLLLQQQQKQHQNDHSDARQGNMACWNPLNIPAIKTEPRDTSPQPFALYRAPPELTPSPQPLSPTGTYNHNTPSPYSIASTTTGTQANNQQLISPNQQQYNPGNGGPAPNGGAGNGGSVNRNGPPAMDMNDYSAFGQQTQPQYHGNNFGGAGATHWETKYNPTANANNNNLGNLNSSTAFTMPNLLAAANGPAGPGNIAGGPQGSGGPGGGGGGGGWNLAPNPNHFHQHHLQQQQQQQHQQQYQQQHQTNTNDTIATNTNNKSNNSNNPNNNNGNNNTEHGLSNLLNFDSEQLVRINSEDQQMLRLNSEDLQISNLSIST